MTSYEETVANLEQAYETLCKASKGGYQMTIAETFKCQCAIKDVLAILEPPKEEDNA